MWDFLFSGEEVVQNPATGRWFIGAGKPGFNCGQNNRDGFATREEAQRCHNRYAAKVQPVQVRA